ncbi:MAG: metalloregulator ArsR/SmtB family transcription factor [Candidatus Saccharimonas sp.]
MQRDQTTKVLKALADDMRLAIVRSLATSSVALKSCDVVALCSSCGELSQPAMSHHFKKLVDARIVEASKAGTENYYLLNRSFLTSLGIDAGKL